MDFEFDNERPIYLQLVERIELQIVAGQLTPGMRLPSVRDLAVQSKVNPNTMQKALGELEELGLIYTERTNGKFVTTDTELIQSTRQRFADEVSTQFLQSMQALGFDRQAALKYLTKRREK